MEKNPVLSKLANVKLNKFKDEEEGFTLIELLVVILIIGILAAVALPTFLNQGKKGANSAAQSDLRAVSTKVEACVTQTNDYTTCLPAANTTSTGASTDKGSDAEAPVLPAGIKVDSVSASGGYVLSKANPKGTDDGKVFRITSASGNVSAPVGSAS